MTEQAITPAKTPDPKFWANLIQTAGILPVLIVIAIIFSFIAPNFLTENNLLNIVRQASINIALATGMTVVILTGGIDLSVGSVLAVSAVTAMVVSLMPELGWAAVPIALLIGLVLGALNSLLVAYAGLPPFIVTLGSITTLRGLAYLLAGGTTIINSKISFAWIGNAYLGPLPWIVVIAFLVLLATWFLLRHTVLGIYIYGVGGNLQAARQAKRTEFFITGVDGAPVAVEALKDKDSLFLATAAQNPLRMAKEGVEIGHQIKQGKAPKEAVILIPVDLITRDNIKDYKGWVTK